MERLLVVWCPRLLQEEEHGRQARAFSRVVADLGEFATRVDPVRPGVCAVPTRGPSRYFGGDEALARLATRAAEAEAPGVGVADGLFAATLAARSALEVVPGKGPVVVPPEQTPAFLAPWPATVLDRPELADLLHRLGIRTLGRFAALPTPQVLARFGADGVACHRVARGLEGELPGTRLFAPAGTNHGRGRGRGTGARQQGFWGDRGDAFVRAARVVAQVKELLDPEAVVQARLQGGRGPGERARLVPWGGGRDDPDEPAPHRPRAENFPDPGDGPWPGQVPAPAPAVVLGRPLPVALTDGDGRTVEVASNGLATATPARLSVSEGPWAEVTQWSGPWPSDERWWSARGRRRRARLQVVVTGGAAHLLVRERGGWWLEGTYD